MGGDQVPTTRAKLKVPPIPNIEQPHENEKVWEYKNRIHQSLVNRGSRYPPFSIEHMPFERQRLVKWMTEEDRFLRKQWLRDQHLHHEPKYVAEAVPMCRARRLFRMPWDIVQKILQPVLGHTAAQSIRFSLPKAIMGYMVLVAGYYHMVYNPRTWESIHGVNVYGTRRMKLPGDETIFHPRDPFFADGNFHNRRSHFNSPTSSQ